MSSWENLVSGLINEVVGGIVSILVGLWATSNNIKSAARAENRLKG